MLQGRKQTYGQAFGIYSMAEYFRATGDREALELAERLFEDIEVHAFDPESGGYWEARGRSWEPIDDMRLSDIDLNAPFSMNTHLHLLEAYTGLVRASDKPRHRERLRAVLEIILDRIVDARTGHLILFQDERWHRDELVGMRGGGDPGRRLSFCPGGHGRHAAGRRRPGSGLRPAERRDLLRGLA
jgi:mannobiose 2-epimerase